MIRKIIVLQFKIILIILIGFIIDISAYSQGNVGTKEQLSAMNRTTNPSFIDTSNNRSGKPFKVLVIGNSLTRHGIAENIGWTHVSGMAATKLENDFVHLLFFKMESLLPNRKIQFRISNLADFERNYTTFDLEKIDKLVDFQPDVIVFQLGENVSFSQINTPQEFEKKYTDLINSFKISNKPIVICTTPFFPSNEKNQIIERVALNTKSFVADLSHLPLLDKENYSRDENNYAGNRNEWKNSGIGIHPGDTGMKNIAQQLFIILNASIDYKEAE